ncbi:uncharacterized protein [Aegilops tauschii subsp. strangulata]|uniref:uncharacterized protein n=1 Tax=Aegilops tauschii subsp. strangulata TaxID=200361 RepID=UPI001ABC202A|nr:uncharacterized protein LOC120968685 [Aegilops tauschii subsp. strangulata]XP_045086936.1 uncharacterized protein LOC120968685 [Aegilops tauschii subsp. strangulata]
MDRQGNGDPGDDESATASWEVGGGSEAGAEVTGVTRGSEPEAEGVPGGVLAGVTAGSVTKPSKVGGGSKAQAEASSKAGGGSVVGAEVEGSSASFVAEGMGVPLVLTVAEIAAQGFDIGVDILLTTVEEDVDPDAEAEFDAMILANNLRFAQQLRQGIHNDTLHGSSISQVPPADTFQPEHENEDENVHTNQPNPENDTLLGSGSSLYQGIHNDTLHGSSISQGGDNDPGSATRFKLKVPSAYQGLAALENSEVHGFAIANDLRESLNSNQGWATENQILGLLQNRQIFQLLENEVTAINDTAQGVVAVVPQSSVDALSITPEYTSSRRILKEHGPSKLKVSGVTINKFVVKGNLWSRRHYTIDNTCHIFEWPAKPVANEIQAVPPRTRARTTEELIASNAAVVASHGRVLESNAAVVESNNRLTAAIYQLIARLGESSNSRP